MGKRRPEKIRSTGRGGIVGFSKPSRPSIQHRGNFYQASILLLSQCMWGLTKEDSRHWCEVHDLKLDAAGLPVIKERAHSVTLLLSKTNWSKLTWLSSFIASHLEPFDECLLLVTLWGVWPSSENWHLFYRLRESYSERRQLWAAPGHLFLRHEGADLATFIEMALLCGWDFYLVTSPDYHAAFVSHDEFLKFFTNDGEAAQNVRHCLDAERGAPLANP